jgi:ribosomal protein S8
VRIESDCVRQSQAAEEALTVLKETGFLVEGYTVQTEADSGTFSIDLDLAISEGERPLERLE